MDKELQEYYEGQFDLFLSQGWKDFEEDIIKVRDALPTITQINTVEELHKLKGQLDILNWILARKTDCETAYKQLTED